MQESRTASTEQHRILLNWKAALRREERRRTEVHMAALREP